MFVKNPNVIEEKIEEEIIIFDSLQKKYYLLNEMATIIWEKIFTANNVKELVDDIYNMVEEKDGDDICTIEKDANEVIQKFMADKLITIKENIKSVQ